MIRFSNTTEVAAIRWIPNYESTVYCFAGGFKPTGSECCHLEPRERA